MTEKSFLSFNEDGTVEYVTEQRSPRSITEDFIDKISSGAVRNIKNAFTIDGQPCGILHSKEQTYAYKFMTKLKINCTFKIVDKILRPIFMHEQMKSSSGTVYPQFQAEWSVPSSMRLMFAAKIKEQGDGIGLYTDPNHGCLLIAWLGKAARRLPLPNLYDNCDMCTGTYDGRGKTIADAFKKAVDQMDLSEWNSDLLDENRQRNADELFQFKPGEGGEMVSLPYTANWQDLCPIAGNTNIELLAGAL